MGVLVFIVISIAIALAVTTAAAAVARLRPPFEIGAAIISALIVLIVEAVAIPLQAELPPMIHSQSRAQFLVNMLAFEIPSSAAIGFFAWSGSGLLRSSAYVAGMRWTGIVSLGVTTAAVARIFALGRGTTPLFWIALCGGLVLAVAWGVIEVRTDRSGTGYFKFLGWLQLATALCLAFLSAALLFYAYGVGGWINPILDIFPTQ